MTSPGCISCPIKVIFLPSLSCTGVPRLITADMVKEGAAVIDVGINRIHDPKTGKLRLIGDVDFEGEAVKCLFAFCQQGKCL